jgi:hypothetical protein
MADVDRIAPPVPTLPSPVGRSVGQKQRRAPRGGRPPPERRSDRPPTDRKPEPDHIDEYV